MNYVLLNYTAVCLTAVYDLFGVMHQPYFNHYETSLADIVFNMHSMMLASSVIVIVLYYPRSVNSGRRGVLVFMAAVVMVIAVMAAVDTLLAVKVVILTAYAVGILKYLPQIGLNNKRKSTEGFSITAVYWDIAGHFLSFGALVVRKLQRASSSEDFSQVVDMTKYVLTIALIGIDCFFLFQHYILFISNDSIDDLTINTSNDSLIQSSKHRISNSANDDDPYACVICMWGLGFGVWGLGFGVWGLGDRKSVV